MSDDDIINQALSILAGRLQKGEVISSHADLRNFLTLRIAGNRRETVSVLFLDTKNHLIKYEEMFEGTINHCAIYVREVVSKALMLDASAVVIAHNHPSGVCEPSAQDTAMTRDLRDGLHACGIALHDHVLCAGVDTYSFKANGLF